MEKRSICVVLAVVILLFLVIAAPVSAETSPQVTPEKVDEVVTGIMKEKRIPGLSIAISMPGKTIERSYGSSNKEHNIPVERDSVFEIGSVSKTFAAIGILILQQDGKLSVNDRITKYFPQYPQWHDITLKHLLQHTSGISEMTDTEPFKSNQKKDWTPQEVIARMAAEPLDYEPGQKARYSNVGCIILGLVIEKVTGVSYGDFLDKRIVKPLGMTHTVLGSKSAIVPKRVSGYIYAGKLMNAPYASLILPYASGGMTSTSSDLIKLAKVFTAKALLTKRSIGDMFSPARLNNGTEFVFTDPGLPMTFGYGLDSIMIGSRVIPAKTGGISGFNSFFAYFPESQTMVALTANLDNSLGSLISIVHTLFGLKDK
ncbi:MAG TPA: serine hydrolase domain-containing protein [Syntrophorhabdaceae bacterium]|nr:serine hydrolase domain-containing protein [Syntrophorhabdaceae bacterium]